MVFTQVFGLKREVVDVKNRIFLTPTFTNYSSTQKPLDGPGYLFSMLWVSILCIYVPNLVDFYLRAENRTQFEIANLMIFCIEAENREVV